MTLYIAIVDLDSGTPFHLFSAASEDAVYEQAARFIGGHEAAIDLGVVEARNTYDARRGRRYIRHDVPHDHKPDHQRDENRLFWGQIMDNLFADLDNQEWFLGEKQAEVERQALAFRSPEDDL